MWIEYTRTHPDGQPQVRALKLPWMDSAVEFSMNGKANVPEDVGERLCEERDDVAPSGGTASNESAEESDSESESDSDSDADADADSE